MPPDPHVDLAPARQPHLQRRLERRAIMHHPRLPLAAQQPQQMLPQVALHAPHRNGPHCLALLVHRQPRPGLPRRRMLHPGQDRLHALHPRRIPRLNRLYHLFHSPHHSRPLPASKPKDIKCETWPAPRKRGFSTQKSQWVQKNRERRTGDSRDGIGCSRARWARRIEKQPIGHKEHSAAYPQPNERRTPRTNTDFRNFNAKDARCAKVRKRKIVTTKSTKYTKRAGKRKGRMRPAGAWPFLRSKTL